MNSSIVDGRVLQLESPFYKGRCLNLNVKSLINKGSGEEGLSRKEPREFLLVSDKARGIVDEARAIAYTKDG